LQPARTPRRHTQARSATQKSTIALTRVGAITKEFMDYDYLFKLVLTGCSSVGKTSLLHRFMDDEFLTVGIPTIGVDFRIKQVNIDGQQVKLQIWDSAGQERFQALTRQYYRNASALCVVYDVTDYTSFERVADWLAEFELYGCTGRQSTWLATRTTCPRLGARYPVSRLRNLPTDAA
ncbi:hypothetical protein BOX15_Mlig028542g1, partial [Macrostomum lignano]